MVGAVGVVGGGSSVGGGDVLWGPAGWPNEAQPAPGNQGWPRTRHELPNQANLHPPGPDGLPAPSPAQPAAHSGVVQQGGGAQGESAVPLRAGWGPRALLAAVLLAAPAAAAVVFGGAGGGRWGGGWGLGGPVAREAQVVEGQGGSSSSSSGTSSRSRSSGRGSGSGGASSAWGGAAGGRVGVHQPANADASAEEMEGACEAVRRQVCAACFALLLRVAAWQCACVVRSVHTIRCPAEVAGEPMGAGPASQAGQ